ncbi:MAG: CoA ester lyase [Pseudomonadota bacterium]
MTDVDPSLWRSLLFVPGARPDRFSKAAASGADAVCIDLEDAVPPQDKESARAATLSFLMGFTDRSVPLGLRVNAVGTPEGEADLAALRDAPGLDFVMMPKPMGLEDIDRVRSAYGHDRVVVVIETARALGIVEAIADHSAVIAGIYGAIDLAGEIGCDLSWEAHLYGRSRCVAAFGAARKTFFDVPYLDVKDADGLTDATKKAKTLGIHARAAIHPSQLAVIHQALAPSAEDITQAQRVVEAFEAAEGAVALLDGQMIELPVIKAARRVLAHTRRG